MGAPDRIEHGIHSRNLLLPFGKLTHGSDEVVFVIIDRRCAEALNHRNVRGGTSADRPEAKLACQIKQRRANCPEAPITRIVAPRGKLR